MADDDPRPTPQVEQRASAAPGPPFSELGRLGVSGSERSVNCWTIVFRGEFHNPYAEAIDGVRLIVLLRGAGDPPEEIDRIESDFAMTIEPGQAARFDRKLPHNCSLRYSNVGVVAFAKRRGAVDLPPPSREVERQAAEAWR